MIAKGKSCIDSLQRTQCALCSESSSSLPIPILIPSSEGRSLLAGDFRNIDIHRNFRLEFLPFLFILVSNNKKESRLFGSLFL